MIFSKIFDIHPPLLTDFIQICDGAYDETDFILMEGTILEAVDFQINQSHAYDLLSYSLDDLDWKDSAKYFAFYLLESFLISENLINLQGNQIIEGILYLVSNIFGLKKDS